MLISVTESAKVYLLVGTGSARTLERRCNMEITLTLTTVTAADAKRAAKALADYRESNRTSNRTNWSRMTEVLTAVYAAVRSGDSVEVTSILATRKADEITSAYNLVHRMLSANALRPHWDSVMVHALTNYVREGNTVTGTSNTTAKDALVFITPTA
jgi:hypothetical protein